ncbi:hypothetical protein BC832DRAFT_434769 [Gaertneriomyces semiglobifer]|nr:hypothetical protein BC832DRAFT_434769 [Gaertneriomyces semiglobifer]
MKTFSYANASLASTPTLVLESLDSSFQNKKLDLFEPVKIGRKVSPKNAPSDSNGLFDSKVLSRLHAEVWYEAGKVMIKDTKSSNGTFINSNRLSEEGQESGPFELHDGDRLDFGIDINNDDGSVMYKKVSCRVRVITPETESEGAKPKDAVVDAEEVTERLDQELQLASETQEELLQLKRTLEALEQQQFAKKDTSASNEENVNLKAKLQETTEMLAKTQTELGAAREEIRTAHSQSMGDGSSGSSELQERVTHLEGLVNEFKANAHSAEKTIASLRTELSSAQSHSAKLHKDMQSQARDDVNVLESELQTTKLLCDQLRTDAERLKHELDAALADKAASSEVTALKKANTELKSEIAHLKQEKDRIEKDKQSLEAQLGDSSALRKTVSSLQSAQNAQKDEISTLRKQLEEARTRMTSQASQVETDRRSWESERKSFQTAREEFESERRTFEIRRDGYEKQIKELKEEAVKNRKMRREVDKWEDEADSEPDVRKQRRKKKGSLHVSGLSVVALFACLADKYFMTPQVLLLALGLVSMGGLTYFGVSQGLLNSIFGKGRHMGRGGTV